MLGVKLVLIAAVINLIFLFSEVLFNITGVIFS